MNFRCPECNQILGSLSVAHVKKHGFSSVKTFVEAHPKLAVHLPKFGVTKNIIADTSYLKYFKET